VHDAAVDVALEDDAVIADAIDVRQRKDLEPPLVGENRTRPRHEPVQVA
jgi:hypothetical protein